MMIPTIHLNGTSREELERQLQDAVTALHAAMTALQAAGPNGRDYYLQGPDAISWAIAEHSTRIQKVKEVYDELMEMYEKITE